MIAFPSNGLGVTYFVRRENFALFVEEFFEHPQAKHFLQKKDRKSMLKAVPILIDHLKEDDEGAFFYCSKAGDQWIVDGWNPSHNNTRTWHGDPIEFNPAPILDDLLFGGDGD